MVSVVLMLAFVSIVEVVLGIGLLALVLYPPLQKATWTIRRKRVVFVTLGVLLISPVVAPAGTLAVIPVPIGVFLAFTRSSADVAFLLQAWWFIVPSMLATGFACWYVVHRLFSMQGARV